MNGNQGGREQMHAICAAQYAGAHMCHMAEYYRAASSAPSPPEVSPKWTATATPAASTYEQTRSRSLPSTSAATSPPDPNHNCSNWTTTLTYGAAVEPAGPGEQTCSTTRPVACCE